MLASHRARHCGVCGSNAAVPHEEGWRTVAQSASFIRIRTWSLDENGDECQNFSDEIISSDLIENRKLNGEKRNKWREIRQAREGASGASDPHAIL